ncbi:SDR family oxidoreductase [Pseudonocardia sp. N23]|uniref:SDR family NAD(P)-dependent oxidoreductase n=1 Tax=Pseudonocardia sp. N23 TaxID=1987376 RepID=UPI000BFD230A|nr:SDR family oxidoreductase [Pseudonocardia sp. N23]GAY07098.1 possible short chain dehydrogenase [Pseudonocardia sp. N23]
MTTTALVTGAARGFGLALTAGLVARGATVIVDGRDATTLTSATTGLPGPGRVVAVPGDLTDATHRGALRAAVHRAGALDLLVHNAGALGPSPLPRLADLPPHAFANLWETNVAAPLALTRLLLPFLRTSPDAAVVTLSSDAAVEAYEGWGGYGATKAALDQLAAVLGVEEPGLRVYAFDPGDMRTDMHQRAFPGEDVSDRPHPSTVVPALLALLDSRPSSGRHRAADLLEAV